MVTESTIEQAINAATRGEEQSVVYRLKEQQENDHIASLPMANVFDYGSFYNDILELQSECMAYYASEIGMFSRLRESFPDDSIDQWCRYFTTIALAEIEDMEAEIETTRETIEKLS